MFNHPGMNQYNGFADFSPAFDPRVTLFEIATRSNRKQGGKPRLEAYLAAPDMGWHLAPADNTDSHKGYWWIDNLRPHGRLGQGSVARGHPRRAPCPPGVCHLRPQPPCALHRQWPADGQHPRPAGVARHSDRHFRSRRGRQCYGTVEILGEAGKVLATRAFDRPNASWKLPLDPTLHRYAFLRITQQDGDLAFSGQFGRSKQSAHPCESRAMALRTPLSRFGG